MSNLKTKNARFFSENSVLMTSVTVKVKSGTSRLTIPQISSLLTDVWHSTNSWLVWKYLIMPDSIHILCRPSLVSAISVKKWIGFWKKQIEVNWPQELPINPRAKNDKLDWKIFVRKARPSRWGNYLKKPVKEGLVSKFDDWPFKGEVYPIEMS